MKISVLEWLEETTSLFSGKTAFCDKFRSIDFSYVMEHAKAIGTAIAHEGIYKKPVAIITGRQVHSAVAFLGVAYSGCYYAPIDAKLPVERIKTILDTLKPSLILTDKENEDLAKSLCNCKLLVTEDIENTTIDEESLKNIRRFANENDPLYIIFTSGSTGRPKGVITSHHSLMCYLDAYSCVMEINSDDVLGNQSPLDYIAAVRDIYLPIRHGCTTVIIPKEYFISPAMLFDFMNEYKITSVGWCVTALTVPVALGAFKHGKPNSLKKICFSGSVMPCKYLKVWQDNLPEAHYVNQYGPTEATASCTYYSVDHKVSEDETLPIGMAYRDYNVFLLDEDNKSVPDGKEGEICVSGPILALGYYNDIETTNKSFIQNPINNLYRETIYKTGDIGVKRPDGNFEFHGRKDRQIKFQGRRVELDEIEKASGNIEGIDECSVVYGSNKEIICLFYKGNATLKEIVARLQKVLPGFMIPRDIVSLDEIPKLPNGKTDIKTLKSMI